MVTTRFLPFFHAGLIVKKTLGSIHGKANGEGVTSFQAVSTALAGTLGVGSIVGVATALTMGGPGALFWMCVSAALGMMTKYAEVVLAIVYRQKNRDGSYTGGPMTTLEKGCHFPFLAVLFAVFCIFASFGIGNLTPANTIMETISSYVPMPSMLLGLILALSIAWIIFGKNTTIMRFNEIMIPIVSILYIGACGYQIIVHANKLTMAVHMIKDGIINVRAGVGGAGGFLITKAIHFGIARGVFSNEAGMGSSPIAHAAVVHVHPIEQGFWGIFEVFVDTIVVCTLTGFMILTSGYYGSGYDGVRLLLHCFEEGFGSFGGIVFAVAIISFALPSILGWYYYAHECLRYLFHGTWMLRLYQLVFLSLLVVGPQLQMSFVWNVADTLNGLMTLPNLISILILRKVVVKLTKEYLKEHRSD